jgi:hypothetical protein
VGNTKTRSRTKANNDLSRSQRAPKQKARNSPFVVVTGGKPAVFIISFILNLYFFAAVSPLFAACTPH